MLSWEARAVWYEFLRRCDRSGLVETKRGVRGLAALLRIPADVVDRVLPELLEDGRVRPVSSTGYVAPNFVVANYTTRTDKARQSESRQRRQQIALNGHDSRHGAGVDAANPVISERDDRYGTGDSSHDVTRCHDESQPVTQNRSDQIRTDQIGAQTRAMDGPASPGPGTKRARRKTIPPDWAPREREQDLARELQLDAIREAREFLAFWLGDGGTKTDWDQVFATRLYTVARRPSPHGSGSGSADREIPEL